MSTYQPRRGRPRQPFCPDCLKEDPDRKILKAAGQGYCGPHQSQRVQRNYTRRMRELQPNYVHPKEAAVQLESDIRTALANGMKLTPGRIQEFYVENGLAKPNIDQVTEMYFNDPVDD